MEGASLALAFISGEALEVVNAIFLSV